MLGHRPSDRDVGDGRDRAGAEALDHPARDQDRHRRRESADQQADREQADPHQERPGQPASIDQHSGDDDSEELAQEEAREDPAVQVEAAEVAGDDRHDRRDRQGLRGDDRDVQDEPDRQRPPARGPETVRLACGRPVGYGGSVVHRVRMPGWPRARRGRMTGGTARMDPWTSPPNLPKTVDSTLLRRDPRGGSVEAIHIAGSGSVPMRSVTRVRAIAGVGLEGDRYASGTGHYSADPRTDRHVTLIEAEEIEALADRAAIAIAPGETRRNVTTRGIRPECARRTPVPDRRRRVRGNPATRAVPIPDGPAGQAGARAARPPGRAASADPERRRDRARGRGHRAGREPSAAPDRLEGRRVGDHDRCPARDRRPADGVGDHPTDLGSK